MFLNRPPISDYELFVAKRQIENEGDRRSRYTYDFVLKLIARIDASEAELEQKTGAKPVYEFHPLI